MICGWHIYNTIILCGKFNGTTSAIIICIRHCCTVIMIAMAVVMQLWTMPGNPRFIDIDKKPTDFSWRKMENLERIFVN